MIININLAKAKSKKMINLFDAPLKKRLFINLEENRYVAKFIYGLIVLNVIALIIESYLSTGDIYIQEVLNWLEIISVIAFTFEYMLRLWSSDYESNSIKESIKKRLNFFFSFYGIVDLLAILPFYLPFFIKIDLRSIRVLRLIRLLRIFKIGRYSKSMKLITNVIRDTKYELLITLFVCSILIIFSSTLMYYIENDAQPDKFKNVGHSLWWSVATLTTVGYGDIYPITPIGKLLGAFIAFVGIGFVAMPTAIISSAFMSKLNKKENQDSNIICSCPNCNFQMEVKIR